MVKIQPKPEAFIFIVPKNFVITWTREMLQDVSAFHNIDAEAELIAMLEGKNKLNNDSIVQRIE